MLRVLHGCWALLSRVGQGRQEHGGPRSALLPETSTHEPLRTQMQGPSGATYSFKVFPGSIDSLLRSDVA